MTKTFRPIFNLKTLEIYKCQNDIDACLETLKFVFFLKLDKMTIMLSLLFQMNIDIQCPLVWDLTQFKFYIKRIIYVQ